MAALALGAKASPVVLLPVAAAVFAAAFWLLRRAFRARAGVSYRI
jgi:hypothetical protein